MGRARTKSTARFARCAYCDFGPAAIASCAWVPAPFALTGRDARRTRNRERWSCPASDGVSEHTVAENKKMETQGIDPRTLCMQSTRSTI